MIVLMMVAAAAAAVVVAEGEEGGGLGVALAVEGEDETDNMTLILEVRRTAARKPQADIAYCIFTHSHMSHCQMHDVTIFSRPVLVVRMPKERVSSRVKYHTITTITT